MGALAQTSTTGVVVLVLSVSDSMGLKGVGEAERF